MEDLGAEDAQKNITAKKMVCEVWGKAQGYFVR
jgi:hypothetical protein